MAPFNVIQGCFPHGLPRFDEHRPAAVQLSRQPAWVQQAIAQSAPGRNAAIQPAARNLIQPPRPTNGNAVPLPAPLANFSRHGGQPLPADVRQRMEAVFGASFADVRIHVGADAPAMRAAAFTNGSNVYFAPGQYDPATPQGLRVLAHELAHVVQQRTGRVRNPYGTGFAVLQDAQLEAEASRMGERALHAPRIVQPMAAGRVVQRVLDYDEDASAAKDHLCGGFVRKITWKLTGSDNGPGVILQNVTKTFTVKEVGSNTPMNVSDIQKYVKDNDGGNDIAEHVDYWEAWEVASNATAPKDPDFFCVPCIFKNKRASKETTVGQLEIKGEAFWYPGVTVKSLGMKTDKNHPSAGLPYSTTKPVIATQHASKVTRSYVAKWDSATKAVQMGEYGPTTVTLTKS